MIPGHGSGRSISLEEDQSGSTTTGAPQAVSNSVTNSFAGGSRTIPPRTEFGAGAFDPPDYEILEEIGRGGMGVVYRVRHRKLGHHLALKMIHGGGKGSREDLDRFLTEARAAARLNHPNIAQIRELGEQNGIPFFTLEICEGGSLARFLKRREDAPAPPADAAHLVETVAHAVEFAHRHHIVHRDLTPGNILLSSRLGSEDETCLSAGLQGASGSRLSDWVPKITDFGLAKNLIDGEGPTLSGAVLGTPSYMAPEQAAGKGKHIGPGADVYALGAILYKLLTGSAPFKGPTPMETVLQVLRQEPVAPGQLQPGLPRDLETICLKCLQKDPERRYPSAQALAEDLERWRLGRPISARPIGLFGRLGRWCRRNRAVASLTILAGFLLLAGTVLSTSLAVWAWGEWDRAEANAAAMRAEKTKAERAAKDARNQELRAEENARGFADQRRVAEQEAQTARRHEELAEKQRRLAEQALVRADWAVYRGKLREAHLEWQSNHLAVALERLHSTRREFRDWEFDLLKQLFTRNHRAIHAHGGLIRGLAVSRDGRFIVSGSFDRTVKLWEADSGREVLCLNGHTRQIQAVALAPDRTRIVSGGVDGTVRIWDAGTGKGLHTLQGEQGYINCLAFSPDGTCFVSGGRDGTVKFWDPETGVHLRTFSFPDNPVHDLAFDPDGDRLAVAGYREIRVWDVAGGKEKLHLSGHRANISTLAFDAEGQRLVSGDDDGTVKVWNPTTGAQTHSLGGHASRVNGAAFTPDGKHLLTAGGDMTVRVWDSETGVARAVLRGLSWFDSMALSPDGSFLVVGEGNQNEGKGVLRIWRLDDILQPDSLITRKLNRCQKVALTADGNLLLSTGSDGCLRFWDLTTRSQISSMVSHKGGILALALEPMERWCVTAGADGTVKIWEVPTGKLLRILDGHKDEVVSVAISPDGRRIVSGSKDRTLRMWDAATGRHLRNLENRNWLPGREVLFSPKGDRILGSSHYRWVRIWDAGDGTLVRTLAGHEGTVGGIAVTADGKILASADNHEIRFWDAATGEMLRIAKGHTTWTPCLRFSPDGKRLFSGSHDHTLKVWDAATGQEALTLRGHLGITGLTLSGDGRRLVSADNHGKIMIWDAGERLPSYSLGGFLRSAAFR